MFPELQGQFCIQAHLFAEDLKARLKDANITEVIMSTFSVAVSRNATMLFYASSIYIGSLNICEPFRSSWWLHNQLDPQDAQ